MADQKKRRLEEYRDGGDDTDTKQSVVHETKKEEKGNIADGKKITNFKMKRPSALYKSLNLMLRAMQNLPVVIECKNDVEVSGVIDSVSNNMDIGLSNAKEVFPDGCISESLFLHVNGSSIRYVHIPPKLNTHLLMSNYIKNLENVSKITTTRTSKPKIDMVTLNLLSYRPYPFPLKLPSRVSLNQNLILFEFRKLSEKGFDKGGDKKLLSRQNRREQAKLYYWRMMTMTTTKTTTVMMKMKK